MKHKTRGIALHRINYSDSSLIIQVLTKEFGMKSYMIKGATSKKSSAKKAVFLPLNLLEMEVSHSGKEKIEMVYEARNFPVFTSIHDNIYKSCIAQFLAELMMRSLKHEEINEQLYEYIEANITWLDSTESDFSTFHLYFALGLTRFMGFYPADPIPGNNYFDLTDGVFVHKPANTNPHADPAESALLKNLMQHGKDFKLDRRSKKVLLELILRYYSLHVPSFRDLNSLHVLEEVLA